MRMVKQLVCVLAVASMMFGASMAQAQDGAKPARAPRLSGLYQALAKEYNLTEQQQQQILQIEVERNEYRSSVAAETTRLREAVTAARASGDKDALAKANADNRAHSATVNEELAKFQERIHNVLTREQRVGLEGMNLHSGMMRSLRAAELTDDQKEQAKAIAVKHAPKFIALGADAPRNARGELIAALRAEIEANVLNAEQRAAVAPKPKD